MYEFCSLVIHGHTNYCMLRRSAVFGQTFSPTQLAFSEPTPAGANLARNFTQTTRFLTYFDVATPAIQQEVAIVK